MKDLLLPYAQSKTTADPSQSLRMTSFLKFRIKVKELPGSLLLFLCGRLVCSLVVFLDLLGYDQILDLFVDRPGQDIT